MPKNPKKAKEQIMPETQEQDVAVVETNGEPDDGRTKRSIRQLIDADGNVVGRDDMKSAVGLRFTLVGSDRSWDYIHGQYPFADKCFALFGAPTKFGNVANTVFNPPKVNGVRVPGTVEEAVAEIDSFWQDLSESEIWIAEGQTTGRGLDRTIMARALINLAVAGGKVKDTPEARGEAEQRQIEKFESDKKYWGLVRENLQVKSEYLRLKGGSVKSALDVLEL